MSKTGSYVTGWCSHGAHHGTVQKSASGKEFPSCSGAGGACTCSCHQQDSEMDKLKRQLEELEARHALPAPVATNGVVVKPVPVISKPVSVPRIH